MARRAATMTAVVQNRYGDPEALALSTRVRPQPGPDEVLIAVRAAGLSPGDRAMITGVPYVSRLAAGGLRRPGHPIPGFDCAGVVSEVGDEVADFEIGDRVFGNAPGSFAEYATAATNQLAIIPECLDFVEAAAIPESGCVALQAVRDHGQVAVGQRVAVVGAGGGVGSYVIQLAITAGAHVTGVCRTRMLEAVRALGADEVIDDAEVDLADRGVFDVIIDTAGTTPLRRLRRALTRRGRLIIVGADHRHRVTGGLDRWLRSLLWSAVISQRLRPFVARPLDRRQLDELVELVETGRLTPCIDRTFALAAAADAMRYLDHRDRPGKVVVTIPSG